MDLKLINDNLFSKNNSILNKRRNKIKLIDINNETIIKRNKKYKLSSNINCLRKKIKFATHLINETNYMSIR
jgi:hypothetical protein